MVANINAFLNNFQGGGARQNRYEVFIGFPTTLGAGNDILQKISFTCKASSIPSAEIGVATVPYKGREVKIQGDRKFNDWTITILLDNDFKGRDMFETWVATMIGNTTNVTKSVNEVNPLKTFGQAQVHMLDRNDNIIKRFQLTGIFPTNVGDITIGYDQNDQVIEQQVTFAVNEVEAFDSNGNPTTF